MTNRDWGGLRGILDEAARDLAEQRTEGPVACPIDGEPLVEHDGVRNCPWGNYWWHGGVT